MASLFDLSPSSLVHKEEPYAAVRISLFSVWVFCYLLFFRLFQVIQIATYVHFKSLTLRKCLSFFTCYNLWFYCSFDTRSAAKGMIMNVYIKYAQGMPCEYISN